MMSSILRRPSIQRVLGAVLPAVARVAAAVPRNDVFWAYDIPDRDGSPYITRVLFPRLRGRRRMLHRIHRPDTDRHLHNHPWKSATTLVLRGGYDEVRGVRSSTTGRVDDTESRRLRAGDTGSLTEHTYHRIDAVEPGTWTLFTAGERVQVWGFLIGSTFVDHVSYESRNE